MSIYPFEDTNDQFSNEENGHITAKYTSQHENKNITEESVFDPMSIFRFEEEGINLSDSSVCHKVNITSAKKINSSVLSSLSSNGEKLHRNHVNILNNNQNECNICEPKTKSDKQDSKIKKINDIVDKLMNREHFRFGKKS